MPDMAESAAKAKSGGSARLALFVWGGSTGSVGYSNSADSADSADYG